MMGAATRAGPDQIRFGLRPAPHHLWVIALIVGPLLAIALAAGGVARLVAGGGIVLVLVAGLSSASRVVRPGVFSLEVPVVLLILSTLVFRVRDADTLAANPLDSAGAVRIALVGLAFLLGARALLLTERGNDAPRKLTSRPFRIYLAYIAVVAIGALLSSRPTLTSYRVFELLTGALVIAGALKVVGRLALKRLVSLLYWSIVGLILTVWAGVLIAPSLALSPVGERFSFGAPIPWRIVGVMPVMSANFAGTLGVLLFLWSLAYWLREDRLEVGPRLSVAGCLAFLGLVTLLAAQYRTGYAAALAGVGVLLLLRKRTGIAVLLLTIALAAGVSGIVSGSDVEGFVLRGQSAEVATGLTGRTIWWEKALEVFRESPLIGGGLLTASRFEVLAELGATTTATIHGTWIEALVGTGLVGASLILAAFLITFRRSWAEARSPIGSLIPALLIMVVLVRSLTANTFESFGFEALLFMSVCVWMTDDRVARRAAGESIHAA
jgi:O-antigen ligase